MNLRSSVRKLEAEKKKREIESSGSGGSNRKSRRSSQAPIPLLQDEGKVEEEMNLDKTISLDTSVEWEYEEPCPQRRELPGLPEEDEQLDDTLPLEEMEESPLGNSTPDTLISRSPQPPEPPVRIADKPKKQNVIKISEERPINKVIIKRPASQEAAGTTNEAKKQRMMTNENDQKQCSAAPELLHNRSIRNKNSQRGDPPVQIEKTTSKHASRSDNGSCAGLASSSKTRSSAPVVNEEIFVPQARFHTRFVLEICRVDLILTLVSEEDPMRARKLVRGSLDNRDEYKVAIALTHIWDRRFELAKRAKYIHRKVQLDLSKPREHDKYTQGILFSLKIGGIVHDFVAVPKFPVVKNRPPPVWSLCKSDKDRLGRIIGAFKRFLANRVIDEMANPESSKDPK